MPNITRGDDLGGLMVYLAGPGRHNEHTDPHLVAGDAAVMAWHDDAQLDRVAALDVARQVDHPRRAFGVSVPGGSVWHCSLSLAAEEGLLSDQTWALIAADFVERMGFTGPPDPPDPPSPSGAGVPPGGKAPCRWVAVRHGLSRRGNDHIHIAVSLVREDGTRAPTWNDRPRAQEIAGELEAKYGLQVLESRHTGRGSRGVHPAAQAAADRQGQPEAAPVRLARTVRGCAAAAADEAEFVRRCRRAGLLVRPRFAARRGDVVAGYSVAVRPLRGERPIWYGGGHLARDLTLPRLREQWPDSPDTAAAAAAEWKAGLRNRRMADPGRETQSADPVLWAQCAEEIGALREQLRAVPVEDRATWARVAHETAGVFAAWSLRVEPVPGPLAATADSLARSAQVRAWELQARRAPLPSAKGAALLLATSNLNGSSAVAVAVLLRQLANTLKALHDAHQAAGEAQRAAHLAAAVRTQLSLVAAALQPSGGDSTGGPGGKSAAAGPAEPASPDQGPQRPPGSPIPARLDPEPVASPARPAHQRPARDPGTGR